MKTEQVCTSEKDGFNL